MHKLLLFNSDIKMFIIIVTSIDLGINDQNYWLSSQLIMPSSLLEVIYIIFKKSFLNIILFSKTKTGIKNDAFKYILEVVINCFISLVEVFFTCTNYFLHFINLSLFLLFLLSGVRC